MQLVKEDEAKDPVWVDFKSVKMIDLEGNEIWSASKDVSDDDIFERPHQLLMIKLQF